VKKIARKLGVRVKKTSTGVKIVFPSGAVARFTDKGDARIFLKSQCN
jgi:hypothetical protein